MFIHSPINKHLGIMNDAAVNKGVQISLWDATFHSFEDILRSGIARSYDNSILNFSEEPLYCFPQGLHHFTFLPMVHKGFNFSLSLLTLFVLFFSLVVAILIGVRWYLIVVLIYIFLMIRDIERLSYVPSHLCIFFGEMSIQVLCPFFNRVMWLKISILTVWHFVVYIVFSYTLLYFFSFLFFYL